MVRVPFADYLAISSVLNIQHVLAVRSPLGLGLWSLPKAHQPDNLGLGVPGDSLSDYENKLPAAPLVGRGSFEQYIDHNRPEFGTFTQYYAYNATNWKGPGFPIVLLTPAESGPLDDFLGYTGPDYLSGMIAQEIGAATIVMDMRFMGDSMPYDVYNTTTLQYLTLDQVIADFVRFPHEAKLPFVPDGHSSTPDTTPWIWVGGSLAGALGVWIERLHQGTFWATHATSAPVEAVLDWWQWTLPIYRGMPRNCSADWSAIFAHVDDTLWHGTEKQINNLKAMFDLDDLEHADDVAYAISLPIAAWGAVLPYQDPGGFFAICDAIEGSSSGQDTSSVPGPNGVGLEKALDNYASWYRQTWLPGQCSSFGYPEWTDPYSVQCFNHHNASSPLYAATPDNNQSSLLSWIYCTWGVFWFQNGPPRDFKGPTYYPRHITVETQLAQCALSFPPDGNHSYSPPTCAAGQAAAAELNARTGGWDVTGTRRIFLVNGDVDPWLEAGVASEYRPGGPFQGTENNPSHVIKGGTHCNDLYARSGQVNKDIKALQDTIVAQFKTWTDEFYAEGRNQGRKG